MVIEKNIDVYLLWKADSRLWLNSVGFRKIVTRIYEYNVSR